MMPSDFEGCLTRKEGRKLGRFLQAVGYEVMAYFIYSKRCPRLKQIQMFRSVPLEQVLYMKHFFHNRKNPSYIRKPHVTASHLYQSIQPLEDIEFPALCNF